MFCQYNNIYLKKYKRKNKKNSTTVVTVPLGTVAIVQNFKKKKKKEDKVAQQNGIVDVQRKNIGCKVQKHCTYIRAFIYKKKEHKSMIEKKKVHTEQTKKYILVTVSYFIILF